MMPVNYVMVANFPDSRKTFSWALKGVTLEMQDYAIKIAYRVYLSWHTILPNSVVCECILSQN